VFYSVGSVVHVQKGTSAPHVALHAGRPVLALAASSSKLFVQTGLTVTEYNRAGGASVRHHLVCASATVSKLATNGSRSGTLTVPNAFEVLTRAKGAVVTFSGGRMFLVRIAAERRRCVAAPKRPAGRARTCPCRS